MQLMQIVPVGHVLRLSCWSCLVLSIYGVHPSLDEMIEVLCSPLSSWKDWSEPEPFQPLPMMV